MYKFYKYLLMVFFTIICFSKTLLAQNSGNKKNQDKESAQIEDLYNKGKWEEGKQLAETYLKQAPKDPDVRMLMGKYYIHKKNYDKARYQLVKSLEYAPGHVDAKHMLVTVETETKRYSSAICYINELLEVNPYWKGLWRKKIDLYREMGNHVEANRLLTRISQIYPQDAELSKDRAYQMDQRVLTSQKSGRIIESIDILNQYIEENPNKADSYLLLVDSYIKSGDYANALVATERGLNRFPNDMKLIQKKISVLEQSKRYSEILSYLSAQVKKSANAELQAQYNYFLMEAARHARASDPATLYGQIFQMRPADRESFQYHFNSLMAQGLYDDALAALIRHRSGAGNSKELDIKELNIYQRKDDKGRQSVLLENLFKKYPNDSDIKNSYVRTLLDRAKTSKESGLYDDAMLLWDKVILYGDKEAVTLANQALYSTLVEQGRFQQAIKLLDEVLMKSPDDLMVLLKKADLLNKQGDYHQAMTIYEQSLGYAGEEQRGEIMQAYDEVAAFTIKNLRQQYQLKEAWVVADRWLTINDSSKEALLIMINLSHQLVDKEGMLRFAQIAAQKHPRDMDVKIKLTEALNNFPDRYKLSWDLLSSQAEQHRYHEPLINTFSSTAEVYAQSLLKNKEYSSALEVLNTSLSYKDSKSQKYLKGLAFEGLKKYDSAYYYQQFYEPTLLEVASYKQHLEALAIKTHKNVVAISHLHGRFGQEDVITSISTIEYLRLLQSGDAWGARVNYAGRLEGKGIQGQIEWTKMWSEKFSSRIDAALSNKFFAKLAANVSFTYYLKNEWQAETSLGHRSFYSDQKLSNIQVGVVKHISDFQLSGHINNFLLIQQGDRNYLYNATGKAQYFMGGRRNYLLAMASIGNSPDIDLLDNQFYNSFNVLNTMVGAGIGRSLSKNVGGSIVGNWYNFSSSSEELAPSFKNFYNLSFQVHVSF